MSTQPEFLPFSPPGSPKHITLSEPLSCNISIINTEKYIIKPGSMPTWEKDDKMLRLDESKYTPQADNSVLDIKDVQPLILEHISLCAKLSTTIRKTSKSTLINVKFLFHLLLTLPKFCQKAKSSTKGRQT